MLLLAAGLSLAPPRPARSRRLAAGGKVTITVNGRPPQTQAFERKIFDEDVQAFEAAHPDIHIVPKEGFMDPKTFAAKLAGGQLEDVYYVYFTDPAQLIARHQAADITDYLAGVPHLSALQPQLLDIFKDSKGRLYGLPTANYSMGLLYNRALFRQAGLDLTGRRRHGTRCVPTPRRSLLSATARSATPTSARTTRVAGT